MTPPQVRTNVLRVLQIVVALGLLVLLWHVADGAEAARRLAGADPLWLAAAFIALTLQTVLSALRWRLTAARLGIEINKRTALREYYLSQIVNQALPGGVLGDAGRAVRARAQAGLMASGQAVVFERLAGQTAIFVVLAVAFLATLAVPGGLDWPRWLLVPVAALITGGTALVVVLWTTAHLVPGRVGRWLSMMGRPLVQALAAPEVRRWQIGLSLGTALSNIAAFCFCAWAIGSGFTVVAALALVPLILLTMLIPITISGWGLREGAAAALFPIAGATATEGLATSVAFGLIFLASVLPGFVLTGLKSAPSTMKS